MVLTVAGAGGGAAPHVQETLLSRAYGRIITVVGPSLTQAQTQAIQEVLAAAFQESADIEESLSLNEAYTEELETANDELLKKIQEITQQHDSLKTLFPKLEGEHKTLKDQYLTLNKLSEETKDGNQVLKRQTDKLKTEYETLNQKYVDLEKKQKALEDENSSLVSKTDLLDSDFVELEKDYETLDGENSQLKQESENLKQKYSGLEKQYADLDSETKSLKERFTKLSGDYKGLKEVLDKAIKNQTSRCKDQSGEGIAETVSFCVKALNQIGNFLMESSPLCMVILNALLLYPLGLRISGFFQNTTKT